MGLICAVKLAPDTHQQQRLGGVRSELNLRLRIAGLCKPRVQASPAPVDEVLRV